MEITEKEYHELERDGCVNVTLEVKWDKPKVVAEDSPDMRKARLITALKSNRPIQKDKWGLFMDCLEKHLHYNPKIVQEHPIDYLLDSLQANQVNEGLVCHLLDMVKE